MFQFKNTILRQCPTQDYLSIINKNIGFLKVSRWKVRKVLADIYSSSIMTLTYFQMHNIWIGHLPVPCQKCLIPASKEKFPTFDFSRPAENEKLYFGLVKRL